MTLERLLWGTLRCLCFNVCQFNGGCHIARGALVMTVCRSAKSRQSPCQVATSFGQTS